MTELERVIKDGGYRFLWAMHILSLHNCNSDDDLRCRPTSNSIIFAEP